MGLSFGQALSRTTKWLTKQAKAIRAAGTTRTMTAPRPAASVRGTQRLNISRQASPPPFTTSFNLVGDLEHGLSSAIKDAASSVAAAARDQSRELGNEIGGFAGGVGEGLGGDGTTLLIVGAVILLALFIRA